MGIVRNLECRQLRWGKLRWRRCESIGENDGLGREIEKVGESIGEGDRGDWKRWRESRDILYNIYKGDGDRDGDRWINSKRDGKGDGWRVRDWSANGLFQKSYIRIVWKYPPGLSELSDNCQNWGKVTCRSAEKSKQKVCIICIMDAFVIFTYKNTLKIEIY